MEDDTCLRVFGCESSDVSSVRARQPCFGIHWRNCCKVKMAAFAFKFVLCEQIEKSLTCYIINLTGNKTLANEKPLSFFFLLFMPSTVNIHYSLEWGCLPPSSGGGVQKGRWFWKGQM